MNLALNCRFSQCYNSRILNAKLSPYYFTCKLIIQLMVYKRTITRFIADDKVVYQWVRWEMQLAPDNSWARRCLEHLSWRSWWIIRWTLEQNMAVSREVSQADTCLFWLVLQTEHEVLHCYALNAVYCCLAAGQLYPSYGFSSSADCWCFQVSNRCLEIHLTAFTHHSSLTNKIFKENCIFL